MIRLSERGNKVDELSKMSEDIYLSSDMFVIQTIPWYKRVWYWVKGMVPEWWCRHNPQECDNPDALILYKEL
jgi:hypothetical protein